MTVGNINVRYQYILLEQAIIAPSSKFHESRLFALDRNDPVEQLTGGRSISVELRVTHIHTQNYGRGLAASVTKNQYQGILTASKGTCLGHIERREANRRPLAGTGVALEAPPEPKTFALSPHFPITIGAQCCSSLLESTHNETKTW